MGDPPMNLALDDHRINVAPDIVDGGILHDFDDTGVRIDLDLADMAAIGKAGYVDDLVGFGGKWPEQFVRKIIALQRRRRDLEYPELPVGDLDPKAAVSEFQISRRGLQDV